MSRTLSRNEPTAVAWILLIGVVLVGVYLRVDGFARQGLSGDELHAAPLVAQGFDKVRKTFDRHGSHLGLPMLQVLSGEVFGVGVRSYRLPVLVAGILGLLSLFPVARALVGGLSAWLTTLAVAVNPVHLYYSRFARAYSLVFLLALAFVYALLRAAPSPGGRWRVSWCLAAVPLGAAMLVSHLTSAGILAGCGLASLLIAWRRGRRSDVWVPIAVFAAVGLLAAAVYAPAWEGGLRAYLEGVDGAGSTSPNPVGVAGFLAGGLGPGITLAALALVGAFFLGRLPLDRASLLFAAAIGPVLVLLATRPDGGVDGGTLAYARYLLVALPFLLMLAFWGLERGIEACVPRSTARYAVPALGLAVVVWSGVGGPLWDAHVRRGQFTNDYLALRSSPPLDEPFDEAPAFYREIAAGGEPVVLIEYPASSKMRRMLRNYGLAHGQETLIGLHFPANDPTRGRARALGQRDKEKASTSILLNGPYVELPAADLGGRPEPGYVVVHTNVEAEIARYQAFVRALVRGVRDRSARVFDSGTDPGARQLRKRRALGPDDTSSAEMPLRRRLTRRFGKPVYRDDFIEVWKVRPRTEPGAGASSGEERSGATGAGD